MVGFNRSGGYKIERFLKRAIGAERVGQLHLQLMV